MWPGAPERLMYERMCGAKYPPAPASTGIANGGVMDSAHIALDSDCFSNATASTRRCTPAWIRLAATIPVAPPTEPAVCTRSSGLPTAPSASARYSSGIITPSNRSGALPTTNASTSSAVIPASASARSTASRHSPAMETSDRLLRWWVCPVPRTAARRFTDALAGPFLSAEVECHAIKGDSGSGRAVDEYVTVAEHVDIIQGRSLDAGGHSPGVVLPWPVGCGQREGGREGGAGRDHTVEVDVAERVLADLGLVEAAHLGVVLPAVLERRDVDAADRHAGRRSGRPGGTAAKRDRQRKHRDRERRGECAAEDPFHCCSCRIVW